MHLKMWILKKMKRKLKKLGKKLENFRLCHLGLKPRELDGE